MKQVVPFMVLVAVDLAAQACFETKPASMMVAITSEAPAPESVDMIEVSLRRGGGAELIDVSGAGASPRLPGTLAVDRAPDEAEPIAVTVVASSRGVAQVERQATVSFVEDEPRILRLPLRFACVGATCGEGETCQAGACLPDAVDLAREPADDERQVFGDKSEAGCFRRANCGGERVLGGAPKLPTQPLCPDEDGALPPLGQGDTGAVAAAGPRRRPPAALGFIQSASGRPAR